MLGDAASVPIETGSLLRRAQATGTEQGAGKEGPLGGGKTAGLFQKPAQQRGVSREQPEEMGLGGAGPGWRMELLVGVS